MNTRVSWKRLLLLSILACSVGACSHPSQDDPSPAAQSAAEPDYDILAMKPGTLGKLPGGTLQDLPNTAHCALDAVDGRGITISADVPAGSQLVARGWITSDALTVPKKFALILDGYDAYAVVGVAGKPRPDVAKALGSSRAASSGFVLKMNTLHLPPDTYHVELLLKDGGRSEACDTGKWISVIPRSLD